MNATTVPHSGYSPTTGVPHAAYGAGAHPGTHDQFGYVHNRPVEPIKVVECCPNCQATSTPQSTLIGRLRTGLSQLFVALLVIIVSILRLARLIVAGVLTLIGLIGAGLYQAGLQIVHPDDRRLLPNLPTRDRSPHQ